jgi:hypothetical protein
MQRELIPSVPVELSLPDTAGMSMEALLEPRLALFWGAHTPTKALLMLLTAMAASGRYVRVFDGGNRFDGYFVARQARRMSAHPKRILDRLGLSRAFTCFQLAQLIENAPADQTPLFVLDLLSTFYDESVPLRDTERLLITSIGHLKRLAAVGPVIVGAREPRALVKDRWTLLDRLQVAADAAWMLRAPQDEAQEQPRLF